MKPKLKKHHIAAACFLAAVIFVAVWALVIGQFRIQEVRADGISLNAAGKSYFFAAGSVGYPQNIFTAIAHIATGKPLYNSDQLKAQIAAVAAQVGTPAQNMGVTISNGQPSLQANTTAGETVDQSQAYAALSSALDHYGRGAAVQLQPQQPTVTLAGAQTALAAIQNILASSLTLSYGGQTLKVPVAQIGTWIVQTPDGANDDLSFDSQRMASDLQTIVAPYSQSEHDLDLTITNGTVSNFQPPEDGIGINSDQAVQDVTASLTAREQSATPATSATVTLAQVNIPAGVSTHAQSQGIKQLLGTATTPFTGSTKNRIHNIGVGAAKLNGSLVPAGQQFSTIGTLGAVGPQTGYVEELVILGPNTVPAYGGGLCQVSTTLFRAILAAGMPVTERQNHSYRVSFYERDGNGKSIGPGLDATIYDPSPDLKFMNDSGNPILVTDQIVGTKITFSLYGTSDGRTASVDGPHIIDILPAPPAETVYSATLPPGEVKQKEFAANGADTTAAYTIHYANGTTKTQVFNSHYHGLAAIYITNNPALATPVAATAPVATPPATPAD